MGFVVTTLTFIVIGIVACFCTRVCCNKGPSANLYVSILLCFGFRFGQCFLVVVVVCIYAQLHTHVLLCFSSLLLVRISGGPWN
ncbi:hypothetical protein HanLR1_Chr05g0186941 [Helianthus annuus]|nr:hypothetical protein HanLR1_Chr05g0186941 [Helianthus annuus]